VREAIQGLPTLEIARAWIGRQHSLSDTAIRKRAKANGWTRDLSGAVRTSERYPGEQVRANPSRTKLSRTRLPLALEHGNLGHA
jgi:hypothetical protein